jgi:hypothetical protein
VYSKEKSSKFKLVLKQQFSKYYLNAKCTAVSSNPEFFQTVFMSGCGGITAESMTPFHIPQYSGLLLNWQF